MKALFTTIAIGFLSSSALLANDADPAEKKAEKDDKAAKKAGKKASGDKIFKKADADTNGKVTLAELEKALLKDPADAAQKEKVAKRFKKLDKDGSGDISLEEMNAAPKKKKKDKPEKDKPKKDDAAAQ